jgi:hypothetical protein
VKSVAADAKKLVHAASLATWVATDAVFVNVAVPRLGLAASHVSEIMPLASPAAVFATVVMLKYQIVVSLALRSM